MAEDFENEKMKEVFEKLKDLQAILAEKYDLETKISDTPRLLDEQKQLLAKLKEEFLKKNADFEEVRARVSHLKAELAEVEAIRENGEKGMDSITTHREYDSLEKQISEAKAKESEIRSELLKEEKKMDEIDSDLKMEEEMIKNQELSISEGRESIEKQLNDYNEERAALEAKEKDLSSAIDPEIILKFQRIIKRNREGIVSVKGIVCSGCHMILPAQFANEVHAGNKVMFCPYCSRILYYEEPDESDSNFQITDTGSLADLKFFDDDEEGLDDEYSEIDEDSDDENDENASSDYDGDQD